ncbi:MAG: hypothetical protein HQL14_08095 [Candidatus Omnitrophica bacterium]|nr:hypothetical protein [Candidatus Omnitrophota bacterium]
MQMLFGKSCVICHADKLNFRKKKTFLGLSSPENFFCENCGSLFVEDELKWKLIQIKDKFNPIWQQFQQKSFYVREWVDIVQKEAVGKEGSLV